MTELETRQLLQSLERGDFARHAAGIAPTVMDLWAAICSVSKAVAVTLHGVEELPRKSQWTHPTVSDSQAFVAELDAKVQITSDTHRYHLSFEFQSNHSYAQGGTTLSLAQLLRDVPVLVSVSRNSYSTLSDDSLDYDTGGTEDLYLLEAHDALAISVFEIVTQAAPRKPR